MIFFLILRYFFLFSLTSNPYEHYFNTAKVSGNVYITPILTKKLTTAILVFSVLSLAAGVFQILYVDCFFRKKDVFALEQANKEAEENARILKLAREQIQKPDAIKEDDLFELQAKKSDRIAIQAERIFSWPYIISQGIVLFFFLVTSILQIVNGAYILANT